MKIFLSVAAITTGVGLSILADVILKRSNFQNARYIFLGALLYAAVAVPVALAFKYTQFGTLFIVWEVFMVVGGLVVASIIFKEPFTSYKFLALLFALIALVLSYK